MLLKKIAIAPFLFLIRCYQVGISPFKPATCRYEPSCSYYFAEALKIHGMIIGSYLGFKRILSCHPWGKSGYDPVPPKKEHHK